MEEVLEKEIWKPLIYHGEYFGDTHEISNLGRIRSRKKILKQHANHEGYYITVISRGRDRKIAIRIHRAVAENFVEGDKSLYVNHKDLNKLNNKWDNLEFITNQENIDHATRNGVMVHKLEVNDLDKIWEMRRNGVTARKIAECFNVCESSIVDFLSRKSHKHYYDEKEDKDFKYSPFTATYKKQSRNEICVT